MKKIIDIILEFKKSHSEKKWYGEKKLYNMWNGKINVDTKKVSTFFVMI